eukprot:scaffold7.g3563.t1
MVGHNTGGLGKMPGFYFEAELDNTEDLTGKLERVALRALAASPAALRALGEEAIAKTFPPAQCVELYSQARRRAICNLLFYIWRKILLHSHLTITAKDAKGRMKTDEAAFYKEAWLEDNRPYDAQAMEGKAGAALQTVGFVMRPSHFIVLAAYGNIGALLLTLWSFVIPMATAPLYIVTACLSAIWVPVTPFVFLDIESRVSVSQHGPALMGFSTFWKARFSPPPSAARYISIVIVFLVPAVTGSSVDYSGYLAGTVIVLGSLALAAGGIAATTVPRSADCVYITVAAEVLRLVLVAALVRNHHRENTATP